MKFSLGPHVSRFIDVGANLTDSVFTGVQFKSGVEVGSVEKPNDLQQVVERASGQAWSDPPPWVVDKIVVTGGSLECSRAACALAVRHNLEQAKSAATFPCQLFATVGCHPTRCSEFLNSDALSDSDTDVMAESSECARIYMEKLQKTVEENAQVVSAIGEIGLDYDRTHFCPADVQRRYFQYQLDHLASRYPHLPLFLHCRNAFADFFRIISAYVTNRKSESTGGSTESFVRGVVHSFDGTSEEAAAIIDLGLYIGLNGCSLRTEASLEVCASLPLDRIVLETDSPWCEIKRTHASHAHLMKSLGLTTMDGEQSEKNSPAFPRDRIATAKRGKQWRPGLLVKARNEPIFIGEVAHVVASIRGLKMDEVAKTTYENTMQLFQFKS